MKIKNEDFEVLIPTADGSGIAEKVTVTVPVRWDEELQAWLLTPEAHEIIDNTKARHMGLLLPQEFKKLRERYQLSQKEIGELFQVGEKSWTLWETGKRRPSRSINLLICALYDGEISLNYLLKRAGKAVREEQEWALSRKILLYLTSCHFEQHLQRFSFPSTDEPVIVFRQDRPSRQPPSRWAEILEQTQGPTERALWNATRWRQRSSITTRFPELTLKETGTPSEA